MKSTSMWAPQRNVARSAERLNSGTIRVSMQANWLGRVPLRLIRAIGSSTCFFDF